MLDAIVVAAPLQALWLFESDISTKSIDFVWGAAHSVTQRRPGARQGELYVSELLQMRFITRKTAKTNLYLTAESSKWIEIVSVLKLLACRNRNGEILKSIQLEMGHRWGYTGFAAILCRGSMSQNGLQKAIRYSLQTVGLCEILGDVHNRLGTEI